MIAFTSLALSALLLHTTCLVIRCCALLNVKIAEFRNSPLLVGQHFQVQVGIALQKSDGDAQFKPVFSLLPVDLYSLLLPHYGAFYRHAIKLALALWSSQGVAESPVPKARSSG